MCKGDRQGGGKFPPCRSLPNLRLGIPGQRRKTAARARGTHGA